MQVGIDIVQNERIERALTNSGEAFLNRVFTSEERFNIKHLNDNIEHIAGLWAAKEAAVKALGTGFRHGISFHDIHIYHDEYGCPYLAFTAVFARIMAEKSYKNSTVSISHCQSHAVAVVALTQSA